MKCMLIYCVWVCCPYLAKCIDVLEKVQRPVIKLLYDLSKLPYQTQLITLSLYSLYCGHQRGYLI